MVLLLHSDTRDAFVHGCIQPQRRMPFAPQVEHRDYVLLTKHLWTEEPQFLKREFFALQGLGRHPALERQLILLGGFFFDLEENFVAFLEEFENVLRRLHWYAVELHVRARRSAPADLSWTKAPQTPFSEPTTAWEFRGPRILPVLPPWSHPAA